MEDRRQTVFIAGAGLVGSLLSIFLAKKGFAVQVLEKRADPRQNLRNEGRSINLALSHRGLRALEAADAQLPERILAEAVPMYGRQMHDEQGHLSFQPYSSTKACIYSVSRSQLNNCLINAAEHQGVSFLFEHSIEETDFASKTILLSHQDKSFTIEATVLIAADGVFSKVRSSLEKQGLCHSRLEKIDHGYKELDIPAEKGSLLAPQTALHIWPRGEYMMIALPNFDKSYTGTLFLPFNDEDLSFQELHDEASVMRFFHAHFPDASVLFPDLAKQYFSNPTSFLANVFTDRWAFGEWLLIGDAAHGIVPFYGQGMNAGFEDCRLLDELLTQHHDHFEVAFQTLCDNRKKDTDAIARLAMDNFIEMRDLVADDHFLLQKKIEGALSKALPEQWKTLYSEVTFSDTPYSEALARGLKNQGIMNEIMSDPSLDLKRWEEKEVWDLILKKVSGQ
ncbi:MAG: kynurenine 3-monooxygenase [Chitinophagaceae bacterium]|nr:kynurenine 3-monooxygenase [Chitinophagaceae bacterium]